MSIIEAGRAGVPGQASFARLILPLFAGTLFLSAFLLFSIQPFFAKMVLPRLGGSPGVWSVAMVFFQSILLAGYGYAHFLTSRLNQRMAVLIHAAVMLSAFLVLPIAIPAGWEQAPETGQSLWLLGLFGVAVGLPFFAVSANGPLLQAWFSRTGHPHAEDPYFLYAASNIGSFASLILFIIFFEPNFTVPDQSMQWTAGMVALTVLVIACGVAVIALSRKGREIASTKAEPVGTKALAVRQVLTWVALAFVPSGLLVAVTAHVSVDVAAAPFLWVIPLSLFLLTFVFAFQRKPFFSVAFLLKSLPFLSVAAVAAVFLHNLLPIWVLLPAHFIFFFFAALTCHSLLVERRPGAEHLTAFYLWMSAGGVAGGIFASLVSPALFNWIAEYPILILAALVCRPSLWTGKIPGLAKSLAVAAVGGSLYVALVKTGFSPLFSNVAFNAMILVILAVVAAFLQFRSERAFAVLLVLSVPLAMIGNSASQGIMSERTFFGVVRVHETEDGLYRTMSHGSTMHGAVAVFTADGAPVEGRPEPLTYYHRSGGIARALFAAQAKNGGAIGEGGIIGLGTGSLLCHTQTSERWTVYEIDRSVIDAAKNPAYFPFISECKPDAKMVLGDARLTIADEPDHLFDYLLVDAFSSDSIPVHLITREALQLYMAKLKEEGILTIHISNRYVELMSVLAAVAKEQGWAMLGGHFSVPAEHKGNPFVAPGVVAVLARSEADLGPLVADPDWKPQSGNGVRVWTDDYSDIVSAMWRMQKTRQ